jgi:hypothetical protein
MAPLVFDQISSYPKNYAGKLDMETTQRASSSPAFAYARLIHRRPGGGLEPCLFLLYSGAPQMRHPACCCAAGSVECCKIEFRRGGRAVDCTGLDSLPGARERRPPGRGAAPSTGMCEPKPASAGRQACCCAAGSVICIKIEFRRGGRAVDCTGLENRQGLAPFVGSNPTPSANFDNLPSSPKTPFSV